MLPGGSRKHLPGKPNRTLCGRNTDWVQTGDTESCTCLTCTAIHRKKLRAENDQLRKRPGPPVRPLNQPTKEEAHWK